MKNLPELKIEFDHLDIGLEKLLAIIRPLWKPEAIKHKILRGGITNKLALAYLEQNDKDKVIIRIYGEGTELIIDRKAEVENMLKLHEAGMAATLYCKFSNGLAYEFIEGEIIDENSVRSPQVYRLISKQMATFHSVKIPSNSKAMIMPKIREMLASASRSFVDEKKDKLLKEKYPSFEDLNQEVLLIEKFLSSFKSPIVFSHNDCLFGNIVYNKATEKINFIDYEYSGPNYQAYDIANHFCEFAGVDDYKPELYPDDAFQHAWIRTYLEGWNEINFPGKLVTEADVNELFLLVNDIVMIPNFMWSIWARLQASISSIDFDYLGMNYYCTYCNIIYYYMCIHVSSRCYLTRGKICIFSTYHKGGGKGFLDLTNDNSL
ncbi:Ethanolamine kinase 1 [Nymphon striatum]|nr:Ethanolamine kinase 1 [Nymphon striatum]